jgi:hypothetical protein
MAVVPRVNLNVPHVNLNVPPVPHVNVNVNVNMIQANVQLHDHLLQHPNNPLHQGIVGNFGHIHGISNFGQLRIRLATKIHAEQMEIFHEGS